MLHLPTERLAELGDDTPRAEEAAHLTACDACARERDAYRTLIAMAAAEKDPFGLPLTRWDAIAAELAVAPVAPAGDIAPRRGSNRRMLRIAAGLLLVAGGAMLGRLSAGARPLPGDTDGRTASVARGNPTPASTTPIVSDSATFASAEEARVAQRRSEALYQQAAAFLARVDTTGIGSGSPVPYQTLLAALDRVISTTREAMRDEIGRAHV